MPDAADRSAPFSNPFLDYLTDAAQRTILFWDVMRQRGNQYREHTARAAPHVLSFGFEPIMDGRKLQRPVNYALVRIHQQHLSKRAQKFRRLLGLRYRKSNEINGQKN